MKYFRMLLFTVILSTLLIFPSFASWEKDNGAWRYLSSNGHHISNQWEWIDDDMDGIAECYYFNRHGYLVLGQTVQGYQIDSHGRWVENGIVQTKTLSDCRGWVSLNGREVYIDYEGKMLRNCITPDQHYVDHNGCRIVSKIDSSEMAKKSQGCRLIVIAKGAHTLELWDHGVLKKRFQINSGSVPGDKEVEGDCKTPEGEFYVCKKIPNSNYHLALGISYPAIEDAERGLTKGLISKYQYNQIVTANQNGTTPNWVTPLGGYVEIHGNRTGAPTHGCVSLSNADIETLYSMVSVGDKIIILP